MNQPLARGWRTMAAWADVIDSINVFPIQDGDTGRNLVVSLAPLRTPGPPGNGLASRLLMRARGNAGNIGARFFSALVEADTPQQLGPAARRGRDRARQAVAEPAPGTMLTFFEELVLALDQNPPDQQGQWARLVMQRLTQAVRRTTEQLPVLRQAGVVDAGALGMFLFFEGFLAELVGGDVLDQPVGSLFGDRLRVDAAWQSQVSSGYCIDTVVEVSEGAEDALSRVSLMGRSVVGVSDGTRLKLHLHAEDRQEAARQLAGLGKVISWESDDLGEQTRRFAEAAGAGALHIVTDAAGSLHRHEARRLGVTLLPSYISQGVESLPETMVDSARLYQAMLDGVKVSTGQASEIERYQHYEKVLSLHERALYLCVGSFYTGNYEVVTNWKKEHDPDDRLMVIDTGTASGHLGLSALLTARYSQVADDWRQVVDYASRMLEACQEYAFIDRLRWLAAGGRLSKTTAFFGDMLNKKPVVSPLPQGAEKVAVLGGFKDQVAFILDKLQGQEPPAVIMLEYTNNRSRLEESVLPLLRQRFPAAEVIFQPLSLTSGAHMGPGTWAVAFTPRLD